MPATRGRAARWRSPGEAGLEGDVRKAVAQLGDDPIHFGVWAGFQGKAPVLRALKMLPRVRGGRGIRPDQGGRQADQAGDKRTRRERPGGAGGLRTDWELLRVVGKELTLRSSSKASWQHSQYPFFLLGTVQAADRRLGSWSLASLGRGQVGESGHCWGPQSGNCCSGAWSPDQGGDGPKWPEPGRHRLACLHLASGEAARKARPPCEYPFLALSCPCPHISNHR